MMSPLVRTSTLSAVLTAEERLELARRLFREFYSFCFWHCRPDLLITEEKIPLVVEGLRRHGGRRGLLVAARLTSPGEPSRLCR